jgi:tetratricopeptide (TPR) repeat protein
MLARFFRHYLRDEDSASFIRSVSQCYTRATLERLASRGGAGTRRAAVMALGFLGDFRSNGVLGRALRDSDRGVRVLAEAGIRELWCRDGDARQVHWLRKLIRLNAAGQFETVVHQSSSLLDEAPTFAEAWNQRAMAWFYLENYARSADDCRQALVLNPYQFEAAVGRGQALLELNEPREALDCFRQALRLNPDLEGIRARVRTLRRILD